MELALRLSLPKTAHIPLTTAFPPTRHSLLSSSPTGITMTDTNPATTPDYEEDKRK